MGPSAKGWLPPFHDGAMGRAELRSGPWTGRPGGQAARRPGTRTACRTRPFFLRWCRKFCAGTALTGSWRSTHGQDGELRLGGGSLCGGSLSGRQRPFPGARTRHANEQLQHGVPGGIGRGPEPRGAARRVTLTPPSRCGRSSALRRGRVEWDGLPHAASPRPHDGTSRVLLQRRLQVANGRGGRQVRRRSGTTRRRSRPGPACRVRRSSGPAPS